MKTILHLSEVSHLEMENRRYSKKLTDQALARLVSRDLRWNNAKGTISDSSGLLERFVDSSCHVPHETPEEVFRWEFSRYINNEAFRISREGRDQAEFPPPLTMR